MSFSLVTIENPKNCGRLCPKVIAAEGEITDHTADDFLAFLRGNLPRRDIRPIVFLDSPGGKVIASMELGQAFRRLGLVTIVAKVPDAEMGSISHFTGAECYSACVYALMGGKKRVVPPQSVVGLHRMFMFEPSGDAFGLAGPPRRAFDDGGLARMLRHYAQTMGVSPALIDRAEHMPPDIIHLLSRAEISKWSLAAAKL